MKNNPSNPTPTISEAARRAIALCRQRHQAGGLVRDSEMEALLASALTGGAARGDLDSAHPAPKEGETPETCVFKQAHQYKSPSKKQWERFARSLELRLSEAKRESDRHENRVCSLVEALKARDETIDSLRSHLKTANELLGRVDAHCVTNCDGVTGETVYGVTEKPLPAELVQDIRTRLNQQSK